MKKLLIAAIAATVLTTPAGAATKREPVSLQLSTNGVDFANPTSVDQFRRRAMREIADFCDPANQIGANMPDNQCRKELTAQLARTVTNIAVAHTANAPVRN